MNRKVVTKFCRSDSKSTEPGKLESSVNQNFDRQKIYLLVSKLISFTATNLSRDSRFLKSLSFVQSVPLYVGSRFTELAVQRLFICRGGGLV